jgi:hypothetical protein
MNLPPTLLLDPGSLAPPGSSLADLAHALAVSQREQWPLMKRGYAGLASVRVKDIPTSGGLFRVQFNPARIISTTAPVDEASIKSRPCFLCPSNLPAEQRGIDAGAGLVILCNPYPILREHFTISHTEHLPQRIEGRYDAFLRLAGDLAPRYSVFYNGPRCGASAPDHLHFQAGERGFLPLEAELSGRWSSGRIEFKRGTAEARYIDDGFRRYFALRAADAGLALGLCEDVVRHLAALDGTAGEPMINVAGWRDSGGYCVVIFPRKSHRPRCYFREGDERVLVSPAVIDCGGVMITPVERDFEKMNETLLREVLGDVMGE